MADRSSPEEYVARTFAVAAQQPEHQRDQNGRIEQEQRRDVAERQPAADQGCKTGQGEHVGQRKLRRDARAQQNFEEGRDARRRDRAGAAIPVALSPWNPNG